MCGASSRRFPGAVHLGNFNEGRRRVAFFLVQAMYVFRLFSFRSPDRDRETDSRRIALVQRAVRSAIKDAEAEVIGLRTRIAKARTSVTSLLAQIEDGDAGAGCRAELNNVEQRLLSGERRLAQMKEHLELLRELEGVATRLTAS